MSGEIYTISYGGYTPGGKWNENNPINYKHAANTVAKMFRMSDNDQFLRYWQELTVWGGSLEVVSICYGNVSYDAELEPAEGKYIAIAARRAIDERAARYRQETGEEPSLS